MLTRVEGGTTYTQGWDAENRLTTVTVNGQTTTFDYDGDGVRVKKVQNGQTTVYVGALYEKNVSTNITTTHYFAGSTRIATRVGGVLYYLHGDHLGSTSLTTDNSGNRVGELKYYPKMLTKLGDMLLPQELGAKHGNRYELENRGCNLMQTACAVTSRFETSAFDKYSHTRIKLEKFVEDPLATIDLIKMGGITLFTGGLTIGMVTAVESACLNPIACAGAHAVMAPNIAAAGTATALLARATGEYFMHEFTESVP